MSTLEHLSHNLREGLDSLAEGWQHLWQKTRQAITRFTPSDDEAAEQSSDSRQPYQWGFYPQTCLKRTKRSRSNLKPPACALQTSRSASII